MASRYSRQRELIYDTVRQSRAHPTAEAVYRALKPENPGLSLGTVYRNLHLLAEEGRLMRLPFPVERFDGDLSPHSHFCCDKCGRVSDVPTLYDGDLDAAAARLGHRVSHHSICFYGICRDCAAQEEARDPA